MADELDPIVGNWYKHLDKGQTFKVVGLDEGRGVVEIQHFDGDLESVEIGDWGGLPLEGVEEPEDWTGPLDDVETDDLGYSETDMTAADWRQPSEDTRRDSAETWEDVEPEDERDAWAEGDATEELYDPAAAEDKEARTEPETGEEPPIDEAER